MSSAEAAAPRPPLLVLVGPTAVGKTALSLQLAERIGGEIVSADSRLLYRGMDIGTAKPTPAERARVPHHLIDVADPDEVWSVARYQEAAYAAIDAIHARGKVPLLVGGTGQYVWAVVEGWQVPRVPPRPGLREALAHWGETIGAEALHRRLAALDPAAAARILPSNLRRTVRALEVIFSTGKRFSEQQGKQPPPYNILILGLTRPRPELHARIDARIHAMLAAGWLEEVRRLLEAGYSPDLPAMSGIGYAELTACLQGTITLEEAVRRIQKRTRRFVRRQANWFKADDPRIHWFPAGESTPAALLPLIRPFLHPKACPPAPFGVTSHSTCHIQEATMIQTIRQLLNAKGHQVWAIAPDALVYEALELMAEKDVGALLVMEGDRLEGIFSERDYARRCILRSRHSKETAVRQIMTANVITISPNATIEDAMALMTRHRIRHLPVVEKGKVVGVVSIGDIVKTVIENQQHVISHLEDYITGDVGGQG